MRELIENLQEAKPDFDLYRKAQKAEDDYEKALKKQFGKKYRDHWYDGSEYNAETMKAADAKHAADKAWHDAVVKSRKR